QRGHVAVVARHVNGVVALDVVEAGKQRPIVHLERRDGRIRPAEGVRDGTAKDVLGIAQVAELICERYLLEELNSACRRVVGVEIDLLKLIIASAGERFSALRGPADL